MVVKSPNIRVNINIQYIGRDHSKYSGVFIYKHLSWGAHIQHVNNRVAKKHWQNTQTQILSRPKNNEAVIWQSELRK